MHLSHQGILDVILAVLVVTSVGMGDRRSHVGAGIQGVVDLAIDGRALLYSHQGAVFRSSDTRVRHSRVE